jgi:glycosyltransferase involved in cell wall biosynthesis
LKIDLCIVSYNAKDKLQRLIESIYELNDNLLFDVYIADNSSTDGSATLLKELQGDYGYKLFLNPNVGYSAACNQLAAAGNNEIIALLNADVWFGEGSLEGMINSFNTHPEAAVIGPKQRDERGHITHAGIIGTNDAPAHRGWHKPDPNDSQFRDFIECVTVSGSAYFVRRSVWNEIINNKDYMMLYDRFAEQSADRLRILPRYWTDNPGGFLSTPHYYEETFCSYFVRHLGYKVCYDGSVSIGHSWHGSHEQGSAMDKMFRVSQSMFREACDHFGIQRD